MVWGCAMACQTAVSWDGANPLCASVSLTHHVTLIIAPGTAQTPKDAESLLEARKVGRERGLFTLVVL